MSCVCSHCFSPSSGRAITIGGVGGSDCEGAHVLINIEFLGLHLDKPDKVITSF